jgi:iron(III) transport system permease protein
VVIPLSGLDAWLVGAASGLGLEVDPLLQGSLAALLAGYVIRFLTAGYGSVDSSMRRITPSMMEASLSLGVGGGAMLRRVFLPLLRGGVLTGAVLVLVDVMKEMPLTLMLRPFGWDTLAVKIFELTSEGEWERAAFPAILLVLAGIVPVLMLTGKLDNQES